MDYVTLDAFKIRGTHGHNARERRIEQEFEVSLKVRCDLRAAASSDDLPDTIDFDFLKKCVTDAFARTKYYLVEALAEDIARGALADARAEEVTVSIKKNAVWPDAIPGVTITRVR
ncbi:MAG TPA: dihydroneopterin aldolase [Candidatus Paceibacterota bacterium]|nr:dihydroneopterin aldolase [Candidatus Paceibacterota bacterium]